MFSPRNLIIAGVVLIAIALGSSGHGVWWLFGLLWVLPHVAGGGRGGCQALGRRRGAPERDRQTDRTPPSVPAPASAPDPTSDRHVAFPSPN